jgi:hypothetical protein
MTNFEHFRSFDFHFPRVRGTAMRVASLAMSVLLAACGGGGGGGDSTGHASGAGATLSGASSSTSAASASTPATVTSATDTSTAGTTGPTTASNSAAVPATNTAVATSPVTTNPAQVATGNASANPAEPASAASAASPALPASPASSAAGDVTTPAHPVPTPRRFYGVNGHNNEGGAYDISSPALQLAQLQDLGMKYYRNEVYSQGTANKLANIAQMMDAGGVTVYPVMLMDLNTVADETQAYSAGFVLGQQTATSRHYPYYEVTNEMEAQALTGNVDGVFPQQYDMDKFRRVRGIIRGMIAGIKSVDTSGKIILGGGTWLHYGFAQMLATGTEPDGSIGHPVVDWDITAWHWYSEQGDITNACGGTGCHNVLQALKAFGKPIWLNEIGVRPNYGTDQEIAAYLTGSTMMAQFVALASTYDIESIQSYELYDDPVGGEGNYGLLQNDGVTPKAAYAAFRNFVAAHPM